MSHNYTLINYFLIIKLVQNHLVFSYLYRFSSTNPLPLLLLSWVFFILSMLIHQMANKRNRNNNNNNNGENNQNVILSPPPLPTLEQVLAMQAQMLQTMQQTIVNM
jgi:hypothetical protein